jgi:hypothetical protein
MVFEPKIPMFERLRQAVTEMFTVYLEVHFLTNFIDKHRQHQSEHHGQNSRSAVATSIENIATWA